ncbi:type II secretion system minor pseudopilin GspK [Gilvimarinus sp. DA14]|uniref:type II secretion system minor pseudopilin GspK n=1 Tax=Gilvimarinus sp. DA14 TaxID=2956798 RepID=UPI0020B7F79A|nr:type II secretion system minor pseudopilin GspK [Gilvimarinus sp. DA14]UTF58904.1 type II secretion system minor pseudopilin GspK [Gilvimarinus sp. DA14]
MIWRSKPSPSLPRRQSGTVLILAILVVTLVAGFAIKASRDYQLSMARAEARWHGAQARAYLSGAESLAIYFLELDDNTEVDSLLEPWAMELPPFPIEGGMILAEIADASAKINLNDLSNPLGNLEQGPTSYTRFNPAQKHFLRLLQSFEEQYPLSLEDAVGILEAIVDWTDNNDEITGFTGAESDYYQSLDPAYAAANAPFTSVDELRLVRGFTPELMQLIKPYITVYTAGGHLNVNTINPFLLRTFNDGENLEPLAGQVAGQIVAENGEYASMDEFTNHTGWGSAITGELDTGYAAVTTSYFLVTTRVQLGEQRRSMQSLLSRADGDFKVESRRDVYDYILNLERAGANAGLAGTTNNNE